MLHDTSDFFLLTSLWAIPLLGSLVVLFIPKRWSASIKWISLGFTLATFLICLVSFGAYVLPGQAGVAPVSLTLRERAENNVLGWDDNDQATLTLQDMDSMQSKTALPTKNNGQVEQQEFTGPREVFSRLDSDHNNVLSTKEISVTYGDLVVRSPWIPYFNIQYYLGLDGISLSLVLLTGFVCVLACLASFNIEKQ